MAFSSTITGSDAPTAAVIGAGLSGLTAAFRLRQAGWDVTVFESAPVLGGRVRTLARDGFLLDTGATAIAESYDQYLDLVAELGMAQDIVPASPSIGIYRDGEIHHLRMDRLASSGFRTRLLSRGAKLRALRLAAHVARAKLSGQLDYDDMRKAAPLDTASAREYAERSLGPELSAYLVDPIVRMMLIADGDEISVVELFSGVANIFTSKICSLRGGQGRLPEALAHRVGDVRLSCPVTAVQDCNSHVEVTIDPDGAPEYTAEFDACVISTPLPVAASICPDRSELLAPLNAQLDYTACLSVAVATRTRPRSPALAVEMPPGEDDTVALMFLNHNKSPDRVPPGHGLIECCWVNRASQAALDAGDDAIVARTLDSVIRVFPEVRDRVAFTHVTRWPEALPRTGIGAYKLIGDLNARLDRADRIQFAADYMSAAGQNTAVAFGSRAARNLIAASRAGVRAPRVDRTVR